MRVVGYVMGEKIRQEKQGKLYKNITASNTVRQREKRGQDGLVYSRRV